MYIIYVTYLHLQHKYIYIECYLPSQYCATITSNSETLPSSQTEPHEQYPHPSPRHPCAHVLSVDPPVVDVSQKWGHTPCGLAYLTSH